MVEYGVNVTNKFGFLSDDDMDGPEELLRKAEAQNKREEKSASQKKADKNAAARKKKESAAAAALNAREAEAKKVAQTALLGKKGELGKENKENRPENDRGRGRGRGAAGGIRGVVASRGRGGGAPFDTNYRVGMEQNNGVKDAMSDRFGERRGGRGRGRGIRGRSSFRGARGTTGAPRPNYEMRENDTLQSQPLLTNENSIGHFGNENQNTDGYSENQYRGGYRGGRGGGFGGGGGAGGERMSFRGRGFVGGRGRNFDRLSGSDRTGVKSVEKKDGYGKGNWGNDQEDLMFGAVETVTKTATENEKPEEIAEPREKTEEELRIEAEEEALAKQLTLDEFKAQMAGKRSEPQFNLRQAGEGVNDKDYDRLVPLTKHIVDEAAGEEIVVVRREPRTKHLNIEINFTDEQRGGRNARMRDGFRGGRGSRGGVRDIRGQRPHQGFEVSAEAFPALGSH